MKLEEGTFVIENGQLVDGTVLLPYQTDASLSKMGVSNTLGRGN